MSIWLVIILVVVAAAVLVALEYFKGRSKK